LARYLCLFKQIRMHIPFFFKWKYVCNTADQISCPKKNTLSDIVYIIISLLYSHFCIFIHLVIIYTCILGGDVYAIQPIKFAPKNKTPCLILSARKDDYIPHIHADQFHGNKLMYFFISELNFYVNLLLWIKYPVWYYLHEKITIFLINKLTNFMVPYVYKSMH
jgi:hypothetical protein